MPKTATSPTGRIMREARAKLGLSQHELARLSKVARITIANVELGKHAQMRPSTAYKLARALNLDVSALQPSTAPKSEGRARMGTKRLLDEYAAIKEGTVVAPTSQERTWLENMLAAWGQEMPPSHASVLFLLLARRHGLQ